MKFIDSLFTRDDLSKEERSNNSSRAYVECFGSGGMRLDLEKAFKDGKIKDAIKKSNKRLTRVA